MDTRASPISGFGMVFDGKNVQDMDILEKDVVPDEKKGPNCEKKVANCGEKVAIFEAFEPSLGQKVALLEAKRLIFEEDEAYYGGNEAISEKNAPILAKKKVIFKEKRQIFFFRNWSHFRGK